MRIKDFLKRSIYSLMTLVLVASAVILPSTEASAATKSSTLSFIVLDTYSKSLKIGDSFTLLAVTSTGAFPTFKSSNSKVASVNTYGKVTAKSAGKADITVKISKAEATCKIQVKKTEIELSAVKVSLDVGDTYTLKAATSTATEPTFKSSKTSIASVDENGKITAKKTGSAEISVKADGTTVKCKVTVKEPKIKLDTTKLTMYRNETHKMSVYVSSKRKPSFKTNKSSVAKVSDSGVITAVKHGEAKITVTVDGKSKVCEVTVKSPTIKFDKKEVTMKVGEKGKVNAKVSSGNKPSYSCNKSSVAIVDSEGNITAIKKGTAVITVSEDGTKESLIINVTE